MYVCTASACKCADGYFGTVIYNPEIGTISGCSACPAGYFAPAGNGLSCSVSSWSQSAGYIGSANGCVCESGYYGTVVTDKSSGSLSGCLKCDEGYNSESGNGKSCFPIQCSSPGYTGVAGGCSCNTNGFYGVVTYSSGSPIGCIAISCLNFVSGYTGVDGSCTCADGYYGSVTYANRKPSGCTPCRDGSWSVSGNGNSCIPITCPSPAYTGADGYCSCSAGYSGNIIYSNKAVSGCTACANGFWSTSGTGTLSLSLSLSLLHTYTHTLSLSLSLTHTYILSHTHIVYTLSHSLSFFLFLSQVLLVLALLALHLIILV